MAIEVEPVGVKPAVEKFRGALQLAQEASRRLGWGVADQGMSSISNFAVSIYIARTVGAVQYGAFALAYVTYAFALNASRGLATDPLLVRFSHADLPTWRAAVAKCTGTALGVGLAAGACILAVAAFLNGTTRFAFLALGLTAPALLLQDSWRFAFFALGRGGKAFVNDTVWAGAIILGLVALRQTNHESAFWFVFAWGTAAALAAVLGPLQAGVVPRLSGAREWVSQHRDLGIRYLGEGTSNSAQSQLRTYGIGLILGLAAVGYVQAASTLMGPFMVVFFGIGLLALPEAVKLLRTSPRHLLLFCVIVGAGLALAGLAWGAVLLVALPKGLGQLLLHGLWRKTYPLVLPLTISIMGGCVMASAGTGLHALGAARRSLRAMVISSIIYVVCSIFGALVGGATGTVGGAAVATWLGAVVFWGEFRAALRTSQGLATTTSEEVSAAARVANATEPEAPYPQPGTPAISATSLYHAPAPTVRLAFPVEPLSSMAVDVTGAGGPGPKGPVPEVDGPWEYSGPMADISVLKHVARRGRKAWVATSLAGLVLGAVFHLFVPAKFAAVTDLYMVEPAGADPTAAIANDVSLLGTRSVAEQAVKALHLGVSPAAFLASYQATAVSDVILSVKLSATSPAAAVADDNAVAQAFLHVRSSELALQAQLVVNGLVAQVKALNGQVKSLTSTINSLSAARTGPRSASQVAALVDQRTNDASQITELQSQQQQDLLAEQTAAQGSHVLDPAVAEKASGTKVVAEDALSGLVGGLLLGLGAVVVAGVISERPRLRRDVAAALGVPVELSVGPYRPPLVLRRARRRRRVRRPRPALSMMAQRVFNHLEAAPRSTLAVLSIGQTEPAALCVSALALSLACEGQRVVLVDMAEGRPLWRLVRGRRDPARASGVMVNDHGLMVVVAPPDPAQVAARAPENADFVIVLASVSPALGAEHLSAWATSGLVIVTAGTTATLMASTTELAREAQLNLRSAILVGTTPDDETTGVVTGQDRSAPRVAPAPGGTKERLARADGIGSTG